jgi:hypothetical protein
VATYKPFGNNIRKIFIYNVSRSLPIGKKEKGAGAAKDKKNPFLINKF